MLCNLFKVKGIHMKNNQEKIQNIVVIGGGTSGWMAAAYIASCLNYNVNITLIESQSHGRIGVGEATIPTIQTEFFDRLGMREEYWMPKCQATYKLGIKYVNWKNSPAQGGDYYYQIFGEMPMIDEVPLTHIWLKKKLEENYQRPMISSCFSSIGAFDLKKSPKFYDGKKVQHYAYHFDALLVVNLLKDWSFKHGVKHEVDHLVNVELNEQGDIKCVIGESGKKYSADLFIDCSGFHGFLIEKVFNEPSVSYAESLLTDRAIAINFPEGNLETEGIRPYTTATALNAGWMWEIPLFQRSGNGYVYSSQFISDAQAEQEAREYFGKKAEKADVRFIKFQSRRRRDAWVKNCVSIGLSSNFLEPLESSGIYFIYGALYQLVRNFPNKQIDPTLRNKFNSRVAYMVDDVKDFIVMHFKTTQREDTPFWRANKFETRMPATLQVLLDEYKAGLPIKVSYQHDSELYTSFASQFDNYWTNTNYLSILCGVEYLPEKSLALLNYRDDIMRRGNEILNEIALNAHHVTASLPSQYEYLKKMYGMAAEKKEVA